jgi:hypothetical protein
LISMSSISGATLPIVVISGLCLIIRKAIVIPESKIIRRIKALFFNVYSYMSLRALVLLDKI